MTEDKYFKSALADLSFDVAYGDSIRHLYDKGFSNEEIKEHLETTLSLDRIQAVIDKYEEDKIKNSTTDSQGNTCHYEYVKVTDEYGRSSFIKKTVPCSSKR